MIGRSGDRVHLKPRTAAALGVFTVLSGGPILAQNIKVIHVEVNLNQDEVVIEREFAPLSQTPITRVKLEVREAAAFPGLPGFPELPYLTRVLAVPAGSTLQGISFTPGQQVLVPGVGLVAWAQPPRPGQGANQGLPLPTGPDGSTDFTYYAAPDALPLDPSVGQSQVWPPQMVELADSRRAAGYDLYTFRLYPVQWLPLQDILLVASSIVLDV